MLRRKLLLFLASLVGLLLVVAIAVIWLLQGVLRDLDHINTEDAMLVDTAGEMSSTITQIEIELHEIELGKKHHLDTLIDGVEALHRQTAKLGTDYARPLPHATPIYNQMVEKLLIFQRQVGILSTTQDQQLAQAHMNLLLATSVELRQTILTMERLLREHTMEEQHAVITWFRWLLLGLALVFLLLINIAVMALMRMSHMVLKPVEQLVEASRHLGREEFDYRVAVAQEDEFGELARAYNHLAAQLQANEQRKLETLGQTAVMLSHELNNASAIIKLQLDLLERQSGGNPALERCLKQIKDSLARMTATLEALKRVRRIVLTDYNGEIKMLDLQRSVAIEEAKDGEKVT